jgi:hypothetical protein
MSTFFAHSEHMPCADCGASVATDDRDRHVCDPERQLDFRMFQMRDEIDAFDGLFAAYLSSSAGEFAQWLAEHQRPPVW